MEEQKIPDVKDLMEVIEREICWLRELVQSHIIELENKFLWNGSSEFETFTIKKKDWNQFKDKIFGKSDKGKYDNES